MNFWTVLIDDEEGPTIEAYTTGPEAEERFAWWVRTNWASWFGHNAAICPPSPLRAYEILTDQTGFEGTCIVYEFDISDHPAVKEARATLTVALHRLKMNNLHGEEDPFIQDCETALEMLQ